MYVLKDDYLRISQISSANTSFLTTIALFRLNSLSNFGT